MFVDLVEEGFGDVGLYIFASLNSPGIQHRVTRIVAHPDIIAAQRALTSRIKWERVFSLGLPELITISFPQLD